MNLNTNFAVTWIFFVLKKRRPVKPISKAADRTNQTFNSLLVKGEKGKTEV